MDAVLMRGEAQQINKYVLQTMMNNSLNSLTPILELTTTITVTFNTSFHMNKSTLISGDNTQRVRPFGQPLCLISDEYLEYVNGSDRKYPSSSKKK